MFVQNQAMNIIVAMRAALDKLLLPWGPKGPLWTPVFDSHAINPCYANKIGATA